MFLKFLIFPTVLSVNHHSVVGRWYFSESINKKNFMESCQFMFSWQCTKLFRNLSDWFRPATADYQFLSFQTRVFLMVYFCFKILWFESCEILIFSTYNAKLILDILINENQIMYNTIPVPNITNRKALVLRLEKIKSWLALAEINRNDLK